MEIHILFNIMFMDLLYGKNYVSCPAFGKEAIL